MLKKLLICFIAFVLLSSVLAIPNAFGANWRTYYELYPEPLVSDDEALVKVNFIKGEIVNDDITLPGYIYGVEYWKNDEPSKIKLKYLEKYFEMGPHIVVLDGLEPNTEYTYRGWGQISTSNLEGTPETLSFKTTFSFKYGDLNGDEKINSSDYILLKRYVLDIITEFPTKHGIKLADLNGDGKINSTDCILMTRYILGVINKFPVEEIDEDVDESINQSFIDGNKKFAFNMFKQLTEEEDEKENVFISPFNISVALSMVYQGASSITKDEMTEVLGYNGLDIAEINRSYKNLLSYLNNFDEEIEINNNNSIWNNSLLGDVIKKDFISTNQDVFNAFVTSRDFSDNSVINEINNWISDATEGKIDNMLSKIESDALSYIISAIYFRGIWTEEFDKDKTYESNFKMDDGTTKKIMMMSKIGEVEYGEGNGYRAVRLPYGDGKASMYCVLPDQGTPVNDFIQGMDLTKWDEIKNVISKRNNIPLHLPRFEMDYGSKSLVDSLKALGMEQAFEDFADFSGITDIGVSILDILHKAVIEVNEEGTEAAAATVVIVAPTAIQNPPGFFANRPFMFVIADDEYDTILFMGKLASFD